MTLLQQARAGDVKRHGFADKLRDRVGTIGSRGLVITGAAVGVLSVVFIAMDGAKLYWIRFLDALANGFIYGAVALALVLIYKATGIINFAQGSMAMFFSFVAWVLAREQGWPVWLSILVAMVLAAGFGAAFERIFIRPFDPSNHLPITMVTIALLSILDGLAAMIWAADPKGFPSPFPSKLSDNVVIFGAKVFYATVGIWITVIAITVVLTVLLSKTKIGLAFRSVSSNLESSRLVGINVGRTLQFGWALAAAIGTLAGCLVLSDTKSLLDPSFMAKILVFSFAAATIGGLDSLVGAVVGVPHRIRRNAGCPGHAADAGRRRGHGFGAPRAVRCGSARIRDQGGVGHGGRKFNGRRRQ